MIFTIITLLIFIKINTAASAIIHEHSRWTPSVPESASVASAGLTTPDSASTTRSNIDAAIATRRLLMPRRPRAWTPKFRKLAARPESTVELGELECT